MTEMLANYYFMNHQYEAALTEYEAAFKDDPSNLILMKKLLVSYVLTGRVDRAFVLFSTMVSSDLPCIVKTYDIEEICPFAELHEGLSGSKKEVIKGADFYKSMGMVWIFKDASRSIKYLEQAHILDVDDERLAELIQSINEYLESIATKVDETPRQ